MILWCSESKLLSSKISDGVLSRYKLTEIFNSGKEQKGMFTSVHPGFGMIPFDKLVEAPAREKILEKIKTDPPSTVAGPKKQVELQVNWLNDPSKAQLE